MIINELCRPLSGLRDINDNPEFIDNNGLCDSHCPRRITNTIIIIIIIR
jgi:hypothetical protein